jgi:hypothetical protein
MKRTTLLLIMWNSDINEFRDLSDVGHLGEDEIMLMY